MNTPKEDAEGIFLLFLPPAGGEALRHTAEMKSNFNHPANMIIFRQFYARVRIFTCGRLHFVRIYGKKMVAATDLL